MAKNPRRKIAEKTPKKLSPGEIYKGIAFSDEGDFEEESGLTKKVDPAFVNFCKRLHKLSPALGKNAKFSDEQRNAVAFLGWDLKPEQFSAAAKLVTIASIVFALILVLLSFSGPVFTIFESVAGGLAFLYVFFVPVIVLFVTVNFVQSYPNEAAKAEQRRALTYVPEIVGYLTMSLKLVPNLEKAIEFSAKHGRGRIADELNLLLWNVQIGVYNTLAEGLDDLAYRWGKYSEELKEALMMIRSSVIEDTEAKRYAVLDKTMEFVLESTKEKMEQYARDLSQPSITLFYLGVLLPLILIIILPVGSAFTGQALARPEILILLYNIIIPVTAFLYARHTIKSRPPTYESPEISNKFPGLPGKWKISTGKRKMDLRFLLLFVLIVGVGASFFVSSQGFPPTFLNPEPDLNPVYLLPPDKSEAQVLQTAGLPPDQFFRNGPVWNEIKAFNPGANDAEIQQELDRKKSEFFFQNQNDTTPYNFIFGLLITFSVLAFLFLHFSNIYKRKKQLEIIELEEEFQDSLYIIASRMGENKPIEDALKRAQTFLPNLNISKKVFAKISDNIALMGMPFETAIFDTRYGALVNVPSKIIRSGMKILVDSVGLGVNVAARTVMSLSLQLENSQKVNETLRILVSDVNSMMKSMSIFIAPAVLGITTALQKIVILTLASVVGTDFASGNALDTAGESLGGLGGGFEGILNPAVFQSLTTPLQFLLIVGFYVFELVIIMTYFTTNIEEDNDLLFKLNLAKNIPIALITFVVAVIASNILVGGFLG